MKSARSLNGSYRVTVVALAAVVGAASPALAAGNFSAHPTTPSFGFGSSLDVALGDLDGDGDLDAVVANTSGAAETVWLNDGAGNFSAHPLVPSFGGGDSTGIALGDIDGDTDLDVVVANSASQAETVWLNDGSGSFSAHPTTPSFGFGSSLDVALGDLDGDGDLDAVVANTSGAAETVWLNDGAGNFSAHPLIPSFGGGDSTGIALGDIDGDTDLDVVVANSASQAETVWLNDGSGSFSAHPTTPSFGFGSSLDVALGDLDGDGDLDAVVANTSGAAETVWLNDGAGNFSAHPLVPSFGGGDSTGIALGDFDGDTDLDAVVANSASQAETVWLNDGSGSFSAHPTTPSFGAGDSAGVTLDDLDGDGDLDAVVANTSGEAETVWMNDSTLPTTTTTSISTTTTTTSTTLPPSCPETPETGCEVAAKSSLQIKNNDDAGKDQLKWKWSAGTYAYDDLGDPMTATVYALCVYDGLSGVPALAATIVVEPSILWTTKAPVRWKYKDKEGAQAGVTGVLLKAGESGKAKAQIKAKGVFLQLPAPIGDGEYFAQNPSVLVQLLKHDGPGAALCLMSEFAPGDSLKNEEAQFKAAVK